ncbi:hypothetical protein [Methylobacterium sp. PvR107]|uniref:hypothetical protein n=1 Tax=Methylobacterium sp. PvR107 TaxID=2806597 RepID=UPI001AEB9125|nr:hypothetical protein [Methylobacterium sp. PvR107]MBP1179286.1 hypothetical protein [Methylobacterium sp. PvR107]
MLIGNHDKARVTSRGWESASERATVDTGGHRLVLDHKPGQLQANAAPTLNSDHLVDAGHSASTCYRLQIKVSDASIPGQDVDIDGGVSAGGAVQAMITSRTDKVPIAGSLTAKGSDSSTGRPCGGIIECSGNWGAKRAG